MYDIYVIFMGIKNNPFVAILVTIGIFLLLKNYKKVVLKTGYTLSLILSLLTNAISALGLMVALLGSALGTGYSVKSFEFAMFVTGTINEHIIPLIYYAIVKYQTYIVQKILLVIKRQLILTSKSRVKVSLGKENNYLPLFKAFSMPAPVLLQ